MGETFERQMREELGHLGISLTNQQMEQFFQYYQILVEKNQVMNLTAITEESEVITKHFTDSLSLVQVFPKIKEGEACTMIDVGTGAGFPGIPLKIAFPNCRVTLLDSLNKRVMFLQEVCEKLKLSHILSFHGRAEDMGRNAEFREKYDICVSRAVANLSTLSEYCLPFVKVGGTFISYKSGEIETEAEQAKAAVDWLGGRIERIVPFILPGTDMKRSFVIIRKEKKTHKKYPRKAGLPAKEPLHGRVK